MSNQREPLQIVEVDMDFCQESFGVAPCTASGAVGTECFNTFHTCQDTANFNNGTLTLRFSKNQKTGIFGQFVFPALQSVSTNPTRIALGPVDKTLGSLGKRARVQVSLRDFTWSDQLVDPYVATRSYDPLTQGTFFGKMQARFPYYYGRALRVKNGYVGDNIATMPTRHYIITEWRGPDASGNVQITAQDPIKLADDEFAQWPRASKGQLETDIAADYLGTVNLIPAGIGSEYAASGRIAIGSEVLSFTRSGDVLTITARGLDGSEASDHDANDTVQECYRVEAATIADVLEVLFRDGAGIDAAFLPKADWETELGRWLSTVTLTRTVAKPKAVRQLLSEIANIGIILWWDELDQEIKVKANRPPDIGETPLELTDSDTFLEKTIARQDLHKQRLSQVWYYHGQLDATGSESNPDNFKRLALATDLEAEGPNEYDQERIAEIFQPWFGADGNEQFSLIASQRLLNRYRDTPQGFTFHADAKDIASLTPAALANITTRLIQDQFGANAPEQMQVTSVEEVQPGVKIKVMAETYQFAGRFGFFTENARGIYGAATDAEKTKGTYFSNAGADFADGATSYKFF